jgi:hypothetical protein
VRKWNDWRTWVDSRHTKLAERVGELERKPAIRGDVCACKLCGCFALRSMMHKVTTKTPALLAYVLSPSGYIDYYCQWCQPDYDTVTYRADGTKVCTTTETVEVECGG